MVNYPTAITNGISTIKKHKRSVAIGSGVALVGVGVATAAIISHSRKKSKRRKKSKSRSVRKRNSKNRSSRKLKFGSKAYRKKYLGHGRKRTTPYTARKHKDTSRRRIRQTSKGQPYIILPNGRARFISKKSAKSSRKRKGGRYWWL